jgi:hypothetical protein
MDSFGGMEISRAMKRRRRFLWGFVVLLYAVTWVGGWITHARDLEFSARARYQVGQELNAEYEAHRLADAQKPYYIELTEGGPDTGVNWCIPLLPGVLLVDSYEVLGPLAARDTAKIVVYYGFGSFEVCDLWGWYA